MYRNIIRNTTIALGTLLVSSSLVCAAGLQGSVTALDGKGMGTVRTSDGKDHQVKVGPDFKVGSKVDCEIKNNAMECRVSASQSAATTPTPAHPTGAAATTTPAPASPAKPAAVAPAPVQPSSAAPSQATPAPASK